MFPAWLLVLPPLKMAAASSGSVIITSLSSHPVPHIGGAEEPLHIVCRGGLLAHCTSIMSSLGGDRLIIPRDSIVDFSF